MTTQFDYNPEHNIHFDPREHKPLPDKEVKANPAEQPVQHAIEGLTSALSSVVAARETLRFEMAKANYNAKAILDNERMKAINSGIAGIATAVSALGRVQVL